MFGVFGLAYFGAYGGNFLREKFLKAFDTAWAFMLFSLCIGAMANSFMLFKGQAVNNTLYESMYISNNYIRNSVAYKIPEYLPKTANYTFWRSFEDKNTVPYSEGQFEKQTLDIHYLPYWKIRVDGKEIVPTKFDNFGRPIMVIPSGSELGVTYEQTPIEKIGNGVSVAAFILLTALSINNTLWTRIKKIEN